MKRGHIPLRTCEGCGRKAEKHELIRFVRSDRTLQEEKHAELPGRGVYSCKDDRCKERLIKKGKKTLGDRIALICV